MRGDVYRLRPPRDARGHEQAGPRCAVVVQAEDLAAMSTWIVAPTSTGRRAASFRPGVEIDGVWTHALVEQVTAVDPEVRLGERVGRLAPHEMADVDAAPLWPEEWPTRTGELELELLSCDVVSQGRVRLRYRVVR